MNLIFNVVLILHIVGGSIGLITGMLNLIRPKGGKNHRFIGKLFFVAMLTAGISSLVLACLHPNYFLFMVGVFTTYMVISGQLYQKFKPQNKRDSLFTEWTITLIMFLFALVFIGIGIYSLINSNLFGLVFITFGSLGLLFVTQDYKNYKGLSKSKNFWLMAHLQRMTGGLIAALTAFLVVNANYFPSQIPSFVYWLLPTILLTPLIIKWSRNYEVKKI